MRWTYACPRCEAMLNPDERIILVGVQGDHRVLMAFHPEPGNYELHAPPHAGIVPGSRWDFLCPVCHQSLTTEENENLCSLNQVEGSTKRRVLFSRVAGEHATLVVAGHDLTGYGEHAPTYVNFFLQSKFLK